MARSAVLTGRTTADLARNVFVVILMMVVGFLVGWRIHTNVFGLIAGALLVMLFGYAMSWVFATVGSGRRRPGDGAGGVVPGPGAAGVRVVGVRARRTMPGWLQVFANHQPVSATVNAARALTIGGPTATYVWEALAWDVGHPARLRDHLRPALPPTD